MIENNTIFGNAIKHLVEKFYSLYSSQDDGLEFNKKFGKHNPLGLTGALNVPVTRNYNDKNVTLELPPISDADGDSNLEECFEDIYKPVLIKGEQPLWIYWF